MNAKETIAAIKAAKTAEEAKALLAENEDRATVLDALDARLEELGSEGEAPEENPDQTSDKAPAPKAPKLSGKIVKIKFLKSPTGAYKLGYSAGDEVEIDSAKAADLIENKYAEIID